MAVYGRETCEIRVKYVPKIVPVGNIKKQMHISDNQAVCEYCGTSFYSEF